MTTRILRSLASLGCALLLAGCSTPQAVMDQANNGAALSAALADALTDYAKRTNELDKQRQKLLVTSRGTSLQFRELDTQAREVFDLAGRSDLSKQYQTLRSSADVITKAREDAKADAQAYKESLAKLIGPLPSINDNLAGVGKEFAGLGTELSASARLKAVTDVFAAIKAAQPASGAGSAASPASSPK